MVLGGGVELVGEDKERQVGATHRGSWRRLRHHPGVHVVLRYSRGSHLSLLTHTHAAPRGAAGVGVTPHERGVEAH